MGFPIRKSPDQSLFAAPRGLTQRTTSFIASYRLGIHQTPLSRLIRDSESGSSGRCTARAPARPTSTKGADGWRQLFFRRKRSDSPRQRFHTSNCPSSHGASCSRTDRFATVLSHPSLLEARRFSKPKLQWSVHLDLERLCSCCMRLAPPRFGRPQDCSSDIMPGHPHSGTREHVSCFSLFTMLRRP